MIRIDEIYNNVFYPKISSKLKQSMHYFDPFGRTDIDALRVRPLITERNNAFLYWDQEPYLPEIHDNTINWFNETFVTNGAKVTFVTSEKDSANVSKLCQTHNYKMSYYFFHGWATLDWYRGYNRTFLIPRAKVRHPTKTFISPNRIIGGNRGHRVLFLYHIFKNKLDNNHISVPALCPAENVPIQNIAEKYIKKYPDILNIFNDVKLPRLFNEENTQTMSSCWLTNFNESADSLFYVPTETVYFGRRLHLTEKTFKPIVLEMPFILVATQGSLKYLRSYGFKTFDGIIDESYDEEVDDFIRLEKVTKLLSDINNLSVLERQEIHKQCLPIIEHNYNHFYFGGFEEILWKELTNMLNELL